MKKFFNILFFAFAVMFLGITIVSALESTEETYSCDITVNFKERDTDGNTVNSRNPKPVRHNKLNIKYNIKEERWETASWTTKSQSLTYYPTWTSGGTKYEFVGWYDEDGNPVPESMYDAGNPAKLKIELSCAYGDPQVQVYNYYMVWKAYKAPIIIFNNIDNVAHGSHSATNTDAVASGYKHTFKVPEDVPSNYSFLYWKVDEDKYCDGGTCGESDVYNGVYGDYNTTQTVNAYAWYQPGVKVTYYNEDKSIFKEGEWSFEDVQMISEEPSKPGYEFAGWVDKDGNPVTDKTFKVPEITTEPGKAVEFKLYAKFNRIMVDVKLNKIWVDFKTDYRKSVTFEVYNGETLVGTYTLTEEDESEDTDNLWTKTVSLPRFEEDGTLIEYTVNEISVEYYTSSEATSNDDNDEITVTNTINNSTVVVNHVDEEDGTVLKSETIEKGIGDSYTTSDTTIENYEYTGEYDGEATGFVTPEEQTITYYYRALIGTVTVYYVDIDTGDVLTTETLSGKYKATWEADLTRTFDGYEYVDADGETSGIFGADEIEVTLFYTKNTGDEGEKEDEKDDDIITPPHTDSDVVFVEQQLYLDDRKYRK